MYLTNSSSPEEIYVCESSPVFRNSVNGLFTFYFRATRG